MKTPFLPPTRFLAAALAAAALALPASLAAQSLEDEMFGGGVADDEEPLFDPVMSDDMSVEDLERLIQLPESIRLGREADERLDQPRSLFQDERVRAEILGEAPRVIYIPVGLDPMIIPWVRNEIVARELLEDAQRIFQQARAERDPVRARQAREILENIGARYADTPPAVEAERILAQVRAEIDMINEEIRRAELPPEERDAIPVPVEPVQVVELPSWIQQNTRGSLYNAQSPQDSILLIGDFILRPDEPVPPFPAVTVKEILPAQVVFTFSGRDFMVPIITEQ